MMASSSGRAFSMSSRRTCLTSSRPCGVPSGAAQLALRRGQHPAQAHEHQVVDEIGAGLFRPAAHVVELEADDGVADLGLELSLGLRHRLPRRAAPSRPEAPRRQPFRISRAHSSMTSKRSAMSRLVHAGDGRRGYRCRWWR